MRYAGDLTFNYFQPTRVVFGAGAIRDAGLECKRLGMERAFVVTDKLLREKTDVVAQVEKALGARVAAIFDEVEPDAPADVIDRAAAIGREARVDGIVSVGGGSSIDTAKGIAIVVSEAGRAGTGRSGSGGISIRDFQGSQRLSHKLVPHLAIPTTAGTGSEASMYAVVKDKIAHEKMHYADDHLIPDGAILDPAVTLGMPRWLTAATALDALTHAIEGLQSVQRNPLADAAALHAIRLVAEHLPAVLARPDDLVARGQLLVAAHLGGQAFNASGVGLVHAMAHVIGARHGVHHGTANAICLPHVMRWNADELAPQLAAAAAALGVDTRGMSDDEAAKAASDAVAKLVAASGLPTRLRDAKVPESDFEALAEAALSDGAIVFNGKFAADREIVLGLLRQAY